MQHYSNKGGNAVLNVVLIIAVLAATAAVLYPLYDYTFGRCVDYARPATCQGNLKELGTALALNRGDYDGLMPSSLLVSKSKTWNEDDYRRFATELGGFPPPANANRPTCMMLLYSHMKNKDTIWCPADSNRSSTTATQASYWYKAAIDRAWYGGQDSKGKWSCKKEEDFKFPANQVVFYERASWHWGDDGKGLSEGVALNAAFMDSHVKTIRLKGAGNPVGKSDPIAPGEPGWFNCRMQEHKQEDGTVTEPVRVVKGRYFDPSIYADVLD